MEVAKGATTNTLGFDVITFNITTARHFWWT